MKKILEIPLVKDIVSNKLFMQIAKFIVVGGTAFLIDYYLLIFLRNTLKMNLILSATIGFSVSVIYNYILSTIWVFETDQSKSKSKTFVLFIILSIIGLIINNAVLYVLVELTSLLSLTMAKIIATAIVMVYNFVTRKIFLEK